MVWSNQGRNRIVIVGSTAGLFVYSPVPALGNLVASLAASDGVDVYGNHYGFGLSFTNPTGLTFSTIRPDFNQITIIGPGTTPGAVQINSVRKVLIGYDLIVTGAAGGGFQLDPGPLGKYYAETVQPAATVCATGAAVSLTGLTAANLDSGYGSAYNLGTGVWTCPVDGWFDISGSIRWASFAAGFGESLRIHVNGVTMLEHNQSSGANGSITTAGTLKLAAGDIIDWEVVQATGVNRTISPGASVLTIARRL